MIAVWRNSAGAQMSKTWGLEGEPGLGMARILDYAGFAGFPSICKIRSICWILFDLLESAGCARFCWICCNSLEMRGFARLAGFRKICRIALDLLDWI